MSLKPVPLCLTAPPLHAVMETLPDIFLSHSSQQKGFAIDLRNRLSLSYTVFFDQDYHSLPPGQPFPPLLFAAANKCKLAIVVLSHEFLSSRWPMIELCAFANRLSSSQRGGSSDDGITVLPLFYKLSPEDLKNKENLDRWRKAWEDFQRNDGRFNPSKCEGAVTKYLRPRNGIVRRPESEQGDASYIDQVVDAIFDILPRRKQLTNPNKKYAGRDRLCKIVIDKFRELQDRRSSSLDSCILGMYGVPGTGKTTLSRCLCESTSMSHEFSGIVVYIELLTETDSHANKLSLIKEQCSKLLSEFNPYVTDIASMDLNTVGQLLHGIKSIKKAFLVFDNISATNYDSYKTIVEPLLSSAVFGPGTKILLVAQSATILEEFLLEIPFDSSKHTYDTMEVPSLTTEEAKEVIRNECPSMKEELTTDLLTKLSFPRSSFMYIPFVFEQIGVLFRTKHCGDVEELEILWKMVDAGKKNAVQKLVEMNFKQLPEDLKVLILDIILFIIPAGYSDFGDASPILCRMHGIRIEDTFQLEWKIQELGKRCTLSLINNQLRVHDIFTVYALHITETSASYVFKPSVDISRSLDMRLTCLEARTIYIGTCTESSYNPEVRLHVELGARAKALLVRNRCEHSNCILGLSGDLSSLVCFRTGNVQHVAFSTCGNDVNLSNLVRLELVNEYVYQDNRIKACNGQMRKRTGSSSVDLMSQQIQRTTQLMRWLFMSSRFSVELPRPGLQRLRNLISSGRMKELRVLILHNFGGMLRTDVCPELEILEVTSNFKEKMDVSIEKSPKLQRFVVCRDVVDVARPRILRRKLWSKKSKKLALKVGDCPQLMDIFVDGSFDEVKVDGLLPSKLRGLQLVNDRCPELFAFKWIASSVHHFLELRSLDLSCTKAERLAFTREWLGFLPSLRWFSLLWCTALVHFSMDTGCLPNLISLEVRYCHKLQTLEGVEDILMEKLEELWLCELPQLQWECDLTKKSSGSLCEASTSNSSLQLKKIQVEDCPHVTIDSNVMKASKKLEDLAFSNGSVVQKKQDKNNDESKTAVPLDQWMFSEWQFTSLKDLRIWYLNDLREIEGIQHLHNLLRLSMFRLQDLKRISGAWPASVLKIDLIECPMLLEIPPLVLTPNLDDLQIIRCARLKVVECCFSQTNRFRYVILEDCESMETFPMETESLFVDKWRKRGTPYSSPHMEVCGSKFATVEKMQGWLRDAEMGSPLWKAAVKALLSEHVHKGTLGVLDVLHDYLYALVSKNTTTEEDLQYLENYSIYQIPVISTFFPCLKQHYYKRPLTLLVSS